MAGLSDSQLNMKRTNLLVSILAFETYWAYYSMSSGKVYVDETKKAANNLISSIEEMASLDKEISTIRSKIGKGDITVIERILGEIKKWAKKRKRTFFEPLMQSKVMLWFYFAEMKGYLIKKIGLETFPPIVLSTEEFEHTEKYLRWQPHLPRVSMYWYDKDIDISKLSTTDTIVVYGDIRRSQDLMIYTIGYERFEKMMIRFFDSVRAIFDKNLGIFDKFTGDGFLGYFNEYLSNERGKDFIDCFLKFSKECMEMSKSLFDEWKKYVRKLPAQDIMLSIGADLGKIYFGDRHGHLICIGDAIVWSQRMCTEAPASSIYVNNLLANLLYGKEGVKLSPIRGKTKTGEDFLASELILTQ